MKFARFKLSQFYLRRDPDAGWTLAVWKWRIAFQVVQGPRRRTNAEIDELRNLYNSTYAHWRREGVGGGDAERHAMRVLLAYLSAQPTPVAWVQSDSLRNAIEAGGGKVTIYTQDLAPSMVPIYAAGVSGSALPPLLPAGNAGKETQ
jgi:hypothetical protein